MPDEKIIDIEIMTEENITDEALDELSNNRGEDE